MAIHGACIVLFACASPAPEEKIAAHPVDQASASRESSQPAESEAVAEAGPPWEASDVRSAFSRGGTYLLKWRPTEGRIPKNEHFQIDLWIFEGVESDTGLIAVDGAKVGVAGWMPAHGHGMIRQPQARSLGGGYYSVTGMLFHMGGKWQLFFDLIVDGVSERTAFDLSI